MSGFDVIDGGAEGAGGEKRAASAWPSCAGVSDLAP